MPSYFAFVLKVELKKAGIMLDKILSPNSLWNSSLPIGSYVISGRNRTGWPDNNELYDKYDNDPRYEKLQLWASN